MRLLKKTSILLRSMDNLPEDLRQDSIPNKKEKKKNEKANTYLRSKRRPDYLDRAKNLSQCQHFTKDKPTRYSTVRRLVIFRRLERSSRLKIPRGMKLEYRII